MTAVMWAAGATVAVAALVLLLRARVEAARRQTRATVDAVRAELNLPPGRCRLVEVTLRESLSAALHPSQRLPRFQHVHRVPRPGTVADRQPS